MQHLPAEQQRFEEFFQWSRSSNGRKSAERQFDKDECGEYLESATQRHWWTWQMAVDPDRLQAELNKSADK